MLKRQCERLVEGVRYRSPDVGVYIPNFVNSISEQGACHC